MLTPAFKLSQNDKYVVIEIKAPYVKANDVEIYIDENDFKFHVKPYFLRLTFPCEIIEDGEEEAKYDIAEGIFTIKVPKKTLGEFFPDLDLLTTLLAPKKDLKATKCLVEDITNNDPDVNDSDDDNDDEESLTWEVEQTVEDFSTNEVLSDLTGYKYGFANSYTNVFSKLQNELYEVIDLMQPEQTSLSERRTQRIQDEEEKFNKDHYLADLFEDEHITALLNYKSPWEVEYERILDEYKDHSMYPETKDLIEPSAQIKTFADHSQLEFTEEEKSSFLQLPNKSYLLTKDEERQIMLSLVDVLFAYAYNHRTTEGENTSESAWTICKLSATLSWLDCFHDVSSVVKSSMRRSLCYPLFRHWGLTLKIYDDVLKIMTLGKRWILRCLLEVRDLLHRDENKYMLTRIYIDDYSVWIQKVSAKKIFSLVQKLNLLKISKNDICLGLEKIEAEIIQETLGLTDSTSDEINSNDDESETDSCTSLDSDDISSEGDLDDFKLLSLSDSKQNTDHEKLSTDHDFCHTDPANERIKIPDSHPDKTGNLPGSLLTGIEELSYIHENVKDFLEE